jgi:hypothetical protein
MTKSLGFRILCVTLTAIAVLEWCYVAFGYSQPLHQNYQQYAHKLSPGWFGRQMATYF